jgi:hypothetical protein
MDSTVFFLAIAVLSAVVLVLTFMLVGAWVGVLIQPPFWLKWAAIQGEFAKPIARKLTIEVAILVSASTALIVSFVQEKELRDNYRTLAANLLCQVKATDTTIATVEQIRALSRMKGEYQQTLKAYEAFLSSNPKPSLGLMENLLPGESKRTVYDLRLLGLVAFNAADDGSGGGNQVNRVAMLNKAESIHSLAIAKLGSKPYSLPGNPDHVLADYFIRALGVNKATINISRASLELERSGGKLNDSARTYLTTAANDLDQLWREGGGGHVILLNLVATHALLEQDKEADRIVMMVVTGQTKLPEEELRLFKSGLMDLKGMPELEGYAGRKLGHTVVVKTWPAYVNRIFTQGTK